MSGKISGIVGQIVIPVPFVGDSVGCIFSHLLCRFFTAMAGKKSPKDEYIAMESCSAFGAVRELGKDATG